MVKRYTGCFRVNEVLMFLLISRPIKHLNSLIRSSIFTESIAFWYRISKKCHNHSVIIHIWGLCRCKTVKICKIHWNSRSKQRPLLFCKYLCNKNSDLNEILYGDQLLSCDFMCQISCINACVRGVNVRTRKKRARSRLQLVRAHLCTDLHEI